MICRSIILCIFLFITVTKTQSNSTPKEDLQDEYYTVVTIHTEKPQPSDERDAQAVLDSNKEEKVVASIFAYRDKIRRIIINDIIFNKNDKIADELPTISERRERRYFWISDTYLPQAPSKGVSFTDLLYGLMFEEKYVLAGYLSNFFDEKLEKWINIAMVLTKDMGSMISTYDSNIFINRSFKKSRKRQRDKFEHMLRIWVRHNREPLEKVDPTADAIKQNVDALKKEQDNGGWEENRNQLELILMKKSIKFARIVLQEFEKLNNNATIEDILTNNIKSCGLDENLADTYASLARYIKYKHKYIARILGPQSDGSDHLPAWILCIAVVHPQEWPKIDEAFRENQKGVSLSKFITDTVLYDKVLAEAMAAIVDPKFKPTLFKERPLDNSPFSPPPAKP